MALKTTPTLLVTANVGSIFEDPSQMLKIWSEEFLSTVARLDPKFIALHCQEVGGKNYERSMKHVEDFVRLFMSSEELRLFDKVRVFLDEDYSSAENFTALGNFYFIHESLSDVLIWDFVAKTFVSAKGKEVHSGNIEAVSTKEKSKFPQDFFPECKWSRKGFLRTRWSINGTVVDLINIHLFHDASNFIAMESFPSVYSKNRQRTLQHTLERFHNDSYGRAPFFVFGDFNFRTDTQGVINKLADDLSPVRVQSNKNNELTKVQYKNKASQVILSVGKKEFSHANHQAIFQDGKGMWLKEFDREMEAFDGRLFEFPITFPPSYPFEEDENGGNNYMKTRCPGWCDRVIMSNTAKSLVNNASDPDSIEYGLIGPRTCMGDHKPVFLTMDLINNAGTVSCCTPCETSSSGNCVLCFGRVAVCEPASWSCSSLSLKQSGSAPSSAFTLRLDTSCAALAADRFLAPPHASLLHEPYTPESMETPSSSPIPLRIQRDFEEIEIVEWKCSHEDDNDDDIKEILNSNIHVPQFPKQLSNCKRQSVIQELSSSVQDVQLFGGEPNCKYLPDLIDDEKSKQENELYNGVPHVLICYPDSQESCSLGMDTLKNYDKLHLNADSSNGIKFAHQEENCRKYLHEEVVNASNSICSDIISQERRDAFFPLSESLPDQSPIEKDVSTNKINSSFLKETFSSDSGIVEIIPYMCSSGSLSIENKCTEDLFEESSGEIQKNFCSDADEEISCTEQSMEIIENQPQSNYRLSKSIYCTKHVNMSHSSSVNEPNLRKDSTIVLNHMNINATKKEHNCDNHDSNIEPLPACPQPEINFKLISDQNINSQDCINEMSSHLKKKKKQSVEILMDEKFKENSRKNCSSCCCII